MFIDADKETYFSFLLLLDPFVMKHSQWFDVELCHLQCQCTEETFNWGSAQSETGTCQYSSVKITYLVSINYHQSYLAELCNKCFLSAITLLLVSLPKLILLYN